MTATESRAGFVPLQNGPSDTVAPFVDPVLRRINRDYAVDAALHQAIPLGFEKRHRDIIEIWQADEADGPELP